MTKGDHLSELTDRQLEIIKLELPLLEQRIVHLEGVQYHLRQFSVALWTLTLGVGLGVSEVAESDVRLISASSLIPLVFLYLDAWYARAAQRFRTRRIEIADFINGNTDGGQDVSLALLDFTASNLRQKDPKARYREHLAIKLTRTIRVFFYGFQISGTALLSTFLWASGQLEIAYFVLAWSYVIPIVIAFIVRRSMQKTLKASNSAEDIFDRSRDNS